MVRESFLVLLVVGLILPGSPGKNPYCFRQKYNLDTGWDKAWAKLTVEPTEIEVGKWCSVDICFFNEASGERFYNPFFEGLIPLPAQLAVYDSNLCYIGDLMRFTCGSRRSVRSKDWRFIPSGCYVGTVKGFIAGYVPGTEYDVISNLLPPGDYYLQLIYYKAFMSFPPPNSKDAPAKDGKWEVDFYKSFDRTELFRSNAVKITLTKNTAKG